MDRIRRLIVDTLAKLGGSSLLLGSTDLSVLSSPIIAPEEYLAQCRVTTAACWEWLNQGRFHKVESVLSTLTPTLARFANTLSPYQNIAATLAVEARIMQAFLATQQLDYATREILCVDAVRFGELSGNRRIHTVALEWYGATYTNCYHQPQKAIPIFEQALSGLDSDAWLSKAHISIDLAMAYAQDKDETKSKENETIARDYMEIARLALPKHPELDAFFSHIGLGHSELDQFEGQVYLHLAERFPNSGYAQLAYDAFEKSTSKQAMSKSYSGQALIRRADATRALGDMDEFVKCLTNGLLIAIETNSMKRFNQAHDVMLRIPEVWQRETPIQTLQKDLSHAISGARR